MQLERAGPYVPAITFPGPDVVVTSAFVQAFAASSLTGLTFRPVNLAKAVTIRWESWDHAARSPPVYPPSGEPESYILDAPHDVACADAMKPLSELDAPLAGTATSVMVGFRRYVRTIHSNPDHPDFFRVSGLRYLIVSDRARAWIENAFPGCTAFEVPASTD